MRKLLIGGLATTLVLAMAAVAWTTEGPTHTFTADFTNAKGKSNTKVGTSTGIKVSSDYRTYKKPPVGQETNPAEKITILLAKGAKVDLNAVPGCDEAVLLAGGPKDCPGVPDDFDPANAGRKDCKGACIGLGEALINTGLGGTVDNVKESVTILRGEGKGGLHIYLTGLQTVNIPGTFKGRKLVVEPPQNCLTRRDPVTGKCTDTTGQPNNEAVLTDLTAQVYPRGSNTKGAAASVSATKKYTLIKTPTKCPDSKLWKNTVIYDFRFGDDEKVVDTTKCKIPKD